MPVIVRPYVSPTLVLLAFDWTEGKQHDDFLGFTIERSPGYNGEPKSPLPNRITFDGPRKAGDPEPTSDKNPIQTFHWWDARIDDADRGQPFTYTVTPVCGTRDALEPQIAQASTVTVTLPNFVTDGIGSWFNRAVVSSQGFVNKFGEGTLPAAKVKDALQWLANGMETVIPEFVHGPEPLEGAIYHLTDPYWIIPALQATSGTFVYHANEEKKRDGSIEVVDQRAIDALPNLTFRPRTNTTIMHDKFIVKTNPDGSAGPLLTGSANFTSEGLSIQANVMHSFDAPEARPLAELYLARKRFLDGDPDRSVSRKAGAWSQPVPIAGGTAKVFFSPELTTQRTCLDDAVARIKAATSSVMFCLFDPTDSELLHALFDAAPQGKLLLGLVNSLKVLDTTLQKHPSQPEEVVATHVGSPIPDGVVGYGKYGSPQDPGPNAFWYEKSGIPGIESSIHIHHKFVLVDAETDAATIYTGSANLSNNSLHNNDENLLRIDGIPWLARTYLAEFMRLFEHYRARQTWEQWQQGRPDTYKLLPDSRWARRDYLDGSQKFLLRTRLAPSGNG
jgi:phosphatidylserine/phosphatidylglycerophosphate/cardiolipin synthase-like enzyme